MKRDGFLRLGLVFLLGCARETEPNLRAKRLDAREAAELAADLANRECDKLYGRRPFKSDGHVPKVVNGRWHWGGLDLAGLGGLSAKVVFDADGSDPEVTVYFSSDGIQYSR